MTFRNKGRCKWLRAVPSRSGKSFAPNAGVF